MNGWMNERMDGVYQIENELRGRKEEESCLVCVLMDGHRALHHRLLFPLGCVHRVRRGRRGEAAAWPRSRGVKAEGGGGGDREERW